MVAPLIPIIIALGVGSGLGSILGDLVSPWLRVQGTKARMGLATTEKISDILGKIFDSITDQTPDATTGLSLPLTGDLLATMVGDTMTLAENSDPEIANTLITGMLQQGLALAVQSSLGSSIHVSYATYRGANPPIAESVDMIGLHHEHLDPKLLALETITAGATIPPTAVQTLIGLQTAALTRTAVMDTQLQKLMDEQTMEFTRPEELVVSRSWDALKGTIEEKVNIKMKCAATLNTAAIEYMKTANELMNEVETTYAWVGAGLLSEQDAILLYDENKKAAETLLAAFNDIKTQLEAKRDAALTPIILPTDLVVEARDIMRTEIGQARIKYNLAVEAIYLDAVGKFTNLLKDIRAYRSLLANGEQAPFPETIHPDVSLP